MADKSWMNTLEEVRTQEQKMSWLDAHVDLTAKQMESALKKIDKHIAKHQKQVDMYKAMRSFDSDYGFGLEEIIGVDEAGRGPLAGPVVAAAVVMPLQSRILGIDDSKKLTEEQRESLYEEIIKTCLSYGVGIVGPEEIDTINILEATKKAMAIAISQTHGKCILIDAVALKDQSLPVHGIIKGDEKSYAIAAASIIAKVTRDRLMLVEDKAYPEYGFAAHKGYGTAQHYKALDTVGPSPIHRQSFLRKWSEASANNR